MKTKGIALFLIITMCFCNVTAFAVDAESINAILEETAQYVYKTVSNPQVAAVGGEWAVLGLVRSDTDIPKEYCDKYYENLKNTLEDNNGVLHNRKYTEYSRVVIALSAMGKNPSDISGYNLWAYLEDFDKTTWQGVNGAAFALIALDSGAYSQESDLRGKYVQHILNNQNTDGGWALSGDVSDVDTTAMALSALSNHKNTENVSTAIENALTFISNAQLANGGFANNGIENSESTVQVIVALCELGIDINDTRFVKNNNTTVDNLLTYYVKENGFKHTPNDNSTSLMSTEQGLYALVALDRMSKNKTSLYDMSDVEVKADSADSQNGLPSKSEYVKKLPVVNKGKTFDDIADSAEKSKIEALAERGMINGRTDTEFAPQGTMTRAEFSAIIVKSLGLDFVGKNIFSDVANDSWYTDYVATAYTHGVIKGVSDTVFNPEGTITKEEAAVMVQRASKLCGLESVYDQTAVRNILAGFTDYVTSSEWAREALAFCYDNGILPDSDIEILPKQAVTREEIASMLYNLLSKAKLL